MTKREIIYDRRKRVYQMVWIVESTCPLCGDEIETIFESPPEKVEILEASFMPCEDCLEEVEKEITEQEAEEIEREVASFCKPNNKTQPGKKPRTSTYEPISDKNKNI